VTCREFSDFILDYLSGELGDDVKARFERHLSRCPHCPEYLHQYEDAIRAGRTAFGALEADVPKEVPEELIAAILAATKGE
jgi:anti-sigma factor RsiW